MSEQRGTAMLMDKNNSILLVIDVQENLTPVQESPREVINGCTTLLEVAGELNIPCVIAEQDHKVFGQTMIDLRRVLKKDTKYYEKDTFSCYKNDTIRKVVEDSGRKQIIIAGLEVHLCVLQTAIDFHNAGYEVFVVTDACSSRSNFQNALGLQRLAKTELTSFRARWCCLNGLTVPAANCLTNFGNAACVKPAF